MMIIIHKGYYSTIILVFVCLYVLLLLSNQISFSQVFPKYVFNICVGKIAKWVRSACCAHMGPEFDTRTYIKITAGRCACSQCQCGEGQSSGFSNW